METKKSLSGKLSIQARLVLLNSSLLLAAIVIYGFANYYSLKKASLIIGQERVSSLTDQLGAALNKQMQNGVNEMLAIADRDSIVSFLRSGGRQHPKDEFRLLDKLKKDSTWVSLTLCDDRSSALYQLDRPGQHAPMDAGHTLQELRLGTVPCKIGPMHAIGKRIYYAAAAAVHDQKGKGQLLGYLVIWKYMKPNPQSVAQLSRLVGSGAAFYVGNKDGSFWTNTIQPVARLPFNPGQLNKPIEYNDAAGEHMIAKARPIEHTDWLIAIAFPEQSILKGMAPFLKGIVIVGILLMIIGGIAAWITSHSITRPLKRLTQWAADIAHADYTSPASAGLYRNDEIGDLAAMFATMAAELRRLHSGLENQVSERTAELDLVNKELEAFSYSISHDLRAPLRAINGYAVMLQEDYQGKLDSEAQRIIRTIIDNARNMGKLIDDLLAFSRLNKKGLQLIPVDMREMTNLVITELLEHLPEDRYKITIGPLPSAMADPAMIRQVWVNLLSNAIKYSSKKASPEIEIGALEADGETTYFVKDNGAGFDMRYSDKLFGVFQRLHGQEEFEGTGVGLALAKRILERHNGRIWAESEPDKGAIFFFNLPNT